MSYAQPAFEEEDEQRSQKKAFLVLVLLAMIAFGAIAYQLGVFDSGETAIAAIEEVDDEVDTDDTEVEIDTTETDTDDTEVELSLIHI